MGQGGESGRGNPLPATIVFTEDDFVTTGFFLCVLRLFFFYLGVFHKPHSKGHDETMRAFCLGLVWGVGSVGVVFCCEVLVWYVRTCILTYIYVTHVRTQLRRPHVHRTIAHMHRRTDTRADRHTYTHINMHIDRHTDTQTHRHIYIQTYRHTGILTRI